MNLKKPTREDLVEGLVTNVYLDENNYEGVAKLIERRPSWRQASPYIKHIEGDGEENEKIINWCKERWLVEFLDGRLKGQKVLRWIHYYHSMGIIGNELDNLD